MCITFFLLLATRRFNLFLWFELIGDEWLCKCVPFCWLQPDFKEFVYFIRLNRLRCHLNKEFQHALHRFICCFADVALSPSKVVIDLVHFFLVNLFVGLHISGQVWCITLKHVPQIAHSTSIFEYLCQVLVSLSCKLQASILLSHLFYDVSVIIAYICIDLADTLDVPLPTNMQFLHNQQNFISIVLFEVQLAEIPQNLIQFVLLN